MITLVVSLLGALAAAIPAIITMMQSQKALKHEKDQVIRNLDRTVLHDAIDKL